MTALIRHPVYLFMTLIVAMSVSASIGALVLHRAIESRQLAAIVTAGVRLDRTITRISWAC